MGPVTRLEGWEQRLEAVVAAARAVPYVIGQHDCFRVACAVVEALTGVDRWPEFAGYTTERQALRKLAEHGASFEAAGDWFFGAPRVRAAAARRGDICCYQSGDGKKHLGVSLGARTAVLGPDGLLYVPTLQCVCAWRVG